MPAPVNSRVGSCSGTSEELGTTRCPRCAKKSRNAFLIWTLLIGFTDSFFNPAMFNLVLRILGEVYDNVKHPHLKALTSYEQ